MHLPRDVDDLTADWFAAALDADVATATVVDRHTGTTGRARVALEGAPGVPATVFVKLPPFGESQRRLVDATGMGVAEARFYRDLAPELPVAVPQVWFADTDGTDYVMVLEDLAARGATFPRPSDPDIAERTADIVEQLALLHAPYWDSPRFGPGGDLDWLVERATRGGGGGTHFVENAVNVLGDQMDDDFHRIAACYLAHAPEIVALQRAGVGTLVHGDDHLGNLYVEPDGRTGFLDWAVVCRYPGMRDVTYVLCNSVPPEVREEIEVDLIRGYCDRLATYGVTFTFDEAWEQHRLHAFYAWVAAATTAGMGSKWQPVEIGITSTRRTNRALTHLGTVDLIEERLG